MSEYKLYININLQYIYIYIYIKLQCTYYRKRTLQCVHNSKYKKKLQRMARRFLERRHMAYQTKISSLVDLITLQRSMVGLCKQLNSDIWDM